MEAQAKSTRIILNISSIFGVNFTIKRFKFVSFAFQCFFTLFTIYYLFPTMGGVTIPIYVAVLVIQLVFPLAFGIFMSAEAYKKRNLERKILAKFEKLDEALKENFSVCEVVGEEKCYSKFLSKFSALIIVRILKLYFAGVDFSLAMMFPELVGSANDYLFTYYVDSLAIRIKNYATAINSNNFKVLQVRRDFLAFYNMANMLMQRFQISLFLNITLNFVMLIVNLYFLFIRIVYGPFRLVD